MSLRESIIKILDDAQSTRSPHQQQKLIKSLRTLQEKHDITTFFQTFFTPFTNALLVYKREPAVDRVIDFVAKYAASVTPTAPEEGEDEAEEDDEGDEENFFSLLLTKLLSMHEARDKAVRFRVCQLVGRMLACAAENSCVIGTELVDATQEAMLVRLKDKIPVVRVHAVVAVEILQDEGNPVCPVVNALLELLRKDSSPDVRRCVLNKIAMTNSTLPAIIERTRDVKDTIRRGAFLQLAEKCTIRNLSIQQRIQLLSDGLNDRSDQVQEACVNELLRCWSLSLGGDLFSLLERLDVESSSEVAELALTKLFENYKLAEAVSSMVAAMRPQKENWDEEGSTPSTVATPSRGAKLEAPSPQGGNGGEMYPAKVIPFEQLRCEEAFYWSCLCRYFKKQGVKGEESLEQIVPTVSEFCDYVERFVTDVLLEQKEVEGKMQTQFVAEQLFSIFAVIDLSDEVGRRRLGKLVCDLLVLPEFPAGLTAALLSQQTTIWPQETYRVEKLTEVIADIRHPASPDVTQTMESQLASLSYLELKDDTDTLLHCLAIACELVRDLPAKKLSPTLQTLVDTLLLPCIQNENPYVRDMALNCLGLVCLLDVTVARHFLLLFLQVSQVDHEAVQATALRVVFDLLHAFGLETFNIGEGASNSDTVQEAAVGGSTTESEVKAGGESSTTESVHDFLAGGESTIQDEDTIKEEGDSPSSGNDHDETGAKSKNTNNTTQRILNIMAEFLEGESSLLRGIAAEGIAKLLLSGRVLSQKLLAKLLLLWYNPVTQEEDRLRSVLGAFFPSFAASDRSSRESLGEVYLPVVQMVLEAPPTSPLSEVNTANMADFIIHLTCPTRHNEDSVHDSLAHSIANAVLSDPTDIPGVRAYCRSLSQMELTASNQSNAAALQVLLEQMTQEVTDRISVRYLEKFGAMLKKINLSTEVQSSEGERRGSNRQTETTGSDDETLVAATPPMSTQKRKAKSTTKQKTAAQSAKKRGISFAHDTAHSKDLQQENVDPEELPSLPTPTSLPTPSPNGPSSASIHDECTVSASPVPVPSGEGDCDDSPFITVPTQRRNASQPLRVLQFSDEDD